MTDEPTPAGDVLLDLPLVADAVADEEMAPGEMMADDEIAGSRLLVVRRAVEPIDAKAGTGGVLGLSCTFHAAPGARFTFAQVRVDLVTPGDAVFTDIAPRRVAAGEPVSIKVEQNGKLGLNVKAVEMETGGKVETSYTVYPCLVEGSGLGARSALWRLRESPHSREGIGLDHLLAMTLPDVGDYTARLTVTATLARPGLAGLADAWRALVGRPHQTVTSPLFAFTVPPARSKRSPFRFWDAGQGE